VAVDLVFEPSTEDLGADSHPFIIRSPIVGDARSLSFYFCCSFFFGAVRDMSRTCPGHVRDRFRGVALGPPDALAVTLVCPANSYRVGRLRWWRRLENGNKRTPELGDHVALRVAIFAAR